MSGSWDNYFNIFSAELCFSTSGLERIFAQHIGVLMHNENPCQVIQRITVTEKEIIWHLVCISLTHFSKENSKVIMCMHSLSSLTFFTTTADKRDHTHGVQEIKDCFFNCFQLVSDHWGCGFRLEANKKCFVHNSNKTNKKNPTSVCKSLKNSCLLATVELCRVCRFSLLADALLVCRAPKD